MFRPSTLKLKAGVFKFLWFEEHFQRAPFSWRITVDGRSNWRNIVAFFNLFGGVWMSPLMRKAFFCGTGINLFRNRILSFPATMFMCKAYYLICLVTASYYKIKWQFHQDHMVCERVCPLWLTLSAKIWMALITTMSIPCILTLRVWRWLQHPKQCLHQPKKKDTKSISFKWKKKYLRGGFHGSAHVSKSKYFCSLLNVIVLKTPLRCSSVITCYS